MSTLYMNYQRNEDVRWALPLGGLSYDIPALAGVPPMLLAASPKNLAVTKNPGELIEISILEYMILVTTGLGYPCLQTI